MYTETIIAQMEDDIRMLDEAMQHIKTPEVRTYFEGQRAAFTYAIRLVKMLGDKNATK
jgi:hypothetical protein